MRPKHIKELTRSSAASKTKLTKADNPPLGPYASGDWPLQQRLEAIAAFAPVFNSRDFYPGKLFKGRRRPDNVLEMGGFEYSDQLLQFIQVCYDYGWVNYFDWVKWARTKEYRGFCESPELINKAKALQLAKLLTVVMRRDHFAGGAVLWAFERGIITAVTERAKVLCAGCADTPA